MSNKCQETIYSRGYWGGSRPCGRPIKDADRGMCGIHARSAKNREDKDAARKASQSASDSNWSKGQQSADQIAKILGIDSGVIAARSVRSDLSVFFTGGVTLSAEAAEALIGLLTEESE